MWIFTSDGMISIVRHREETQTFMVRARQPEVLQALFPESEVITTPEADYRYRINVCQSDLIELITDELEDLQYDNFKNNITDHDYHMACGRVWSVMYNYQQGMERLKHPEPKVHTIKPKAKYDPKLEHYKRPGQQARQQRIARSAFPDDFGGCSDNYQK
ncbi:hypothetical protein ACH42_17130 [Endozoicomonas sp. (ex Bugula neritina AB1)]|nr:hypothetical protein ACH42_17130 [Endozoicomonas sp. (ex Bugula neritina AB1)]